MNQKTYRWIYYLVGLLVLAFGIMLNTKAGLGVSPIISVSFSISTLLGANFGDVTFLLYASFVVVEWILHIIMKKGTPELKVILLKDTLQLPLSLVFTRFMNVFGYVIPDFANDFPAGSVLGSMPVRILVLCAGIIFTGIGAAMSLNMRIIPNPGDGIVQALADFFHKPVGFTKNCFDFFNICVTFAVSMIFAGRLLGIGLGTVLAVIGVGRVIAVFNHYCKKPMGIKAGVTE